MNNNGDGFAGVYRAMFLGADALGNVKCMVPAVSGQAPLDAYSADLSSYVPPVPGDIGWVAFEGGDPARPVWIGATKPVDDVPGAAPRFGAWVYRNVDQSVTQGVFTDINFNTAIEDDFGFWSGASATTRLKVPVGGSGVYVIHASATWDGTNSVTTPAIGIRGYAVGGGQVNGDSYRGPTGPTGTFSITHVTTTLLLNAGEEIAVFGIHSTVSARVIEGGAAQSTVEAEPQVRMWRISA